MEKVENNIVRLRPLEPEDIDILYKWENNPEIWQVSHTVTPFSKYIIKKFIENSHLDIYETKQYRFMIDLIEDNSNQTIGTIDLFDFDPYHNRVGIGIVIIEDKHKQKGYAGNALKLLINYVFNTLLVRQVYCNICPSNEASLKLFQKFGFQIIGLKKDWLKTSKGYIDEYLLQLINTNI